MERVIPPEENHYLIFGELHAFNANLLALFTLDDGPGGTHRISVTAGYIYLLDGQLDLFLLMLFLLNLVSGGGATSQADQEGN